MRLKPNARLLGLRPEMAVACLIVESCYARLGVDPVITTGVDGTHRMGSHHYSGAALDFRLHNVSLDQREALVADLREALGPDFDVVWEYVDTTNEHIHVEWDPKHPY